MDLRRVSDREVAVEIGITYCSTERLGVGGNGGLGGGLGHGGRGKRATGVMY